MRLCRHQVIAPSCLLVAMTLVIAGQAAPADAPANCIDRVLDAPYVQPKPKPAAGPVLHLLRQDYEALEIGQCIVYREVKD